MPRTMSVQYVATEFVEEAGTMKLTHKYKMVPERGAQWLWVDASTGAPVRARDVREGLLDGAD